MFKSFIFKQQLFSIQQGTPTNYFSLNGHASPGRRIYVNRGYGGCNRDNGFFVATDKKRYVFGNFHFDNELALQYWKPLILLQNSELK